MKLIKHFIIVIFVFNFSLLNAQDENLQTKITKNLRCLVCQGQSIYDSDSEFANSVKMIVKKKLNDGETEEEIFEYLKGKYGEWILYEPEFSKKTYFLWLLPILMFLIGGAIIIKLFFLKKKFNVL